MNKIVQDHSRLSRTSSVLTLALLTVLVLVPSVVMAQTPSTHFEVLHAFHDGDGYQPVGITLDSAGNLYGAAGFGGDFECSLTPYGCGVTFELSTTGNVKMKILHKFKGYPDGAQPLSSQNAGGGLTWDSQGNLYGVAWDGGDPSCLEVGNGGCGTVFKIDKTGKESELYAFTLINGDGALPTGSLIADKSGNLYGATTDGGQPAYGRCCGTVYKLDKTGNESVLYAFAANYTDGQQPTGLVEDAEGNFYGDTAAGGTYNCGIVFKVDKTGQETVLYSFTGTNGDGCTPNSPLVLDMKGNLYGTVLGGNANGLVFEMTKTGKEKILYSFNGNDGSGPVGPLVFDGEGSIYGVTYSGGSLGHGTVFKLTKAGNETVLHNFSGGKDGNQPGQGLTIDSVGSFYGTTVSGGDLTCGGGGGCGVVFKITP
jgi:uncharacterized repeat protein (TIGR03803 family)